MVIWFSVVTNELKGDIPAGTITLYNTTNHRLKKKRNKKSIAYLVSISPHISPENWQREKERLTNVQICHAAMSKL